MHWTKLQREVCEGKHSRKPHARVRARLPGQELIEFAIIFPLALLFIFGAIDLGRVFYTVIVVSNAAREGARYGISFGMDYDSLSNTYFTKNTEIRSKVKQESIGDFITITDGDIEISCVSGCVPGTPLRVTVTHPFVPFMTWILGQPSFPITRATEMMIP
jgi:Flp pilus assembly protein TadG